MNLDQNKSAARRLRERLDELDVSISHAHSLEGVAAVKGYRNWQTLNAARPASETERIVSELMESCYDFYYELDDIKLALETDTATWFLLKKPSGDASIGVVSETRPTKVYYEGDVFRVDCPAILLQKAPPLTSENDEARRINEWRFSALRHAQRELQFEEGGFAVCYPYFGSFCDALGKHQVGVLVNADGKEWDVTDGKTVKRVAVSEQRSRTIRPAYEGLENYLRDGDSETYAGSAATVEVLLGEPGFVCSVKITELGGFVGFCGLPSHLALSPLGDFSLIGLGINRLNGPLTHERIFPAGFEAELS